jgi:hypothetical protein
MSTPAVAFIAGFPTITTHGYRRAPSPGQTGQTKERLYARAAEIAGKLSAADREEIKGLAAGSGVSCEDALFLNLFYTLTVCPSINCPAAAAGLRRSPSRSSSP